jgi:hypothetical protein
LLSDYVGAAATIEAASQLAPELTAEENALVGEYLRDPTMIEDDLVSEAKRMALYGSLWLDRGEKMDKVHEQVDGMRDMVVEKKLDPPVFAFDVVFRDDQHDEVQRVIAEIEDAIHAAFEDVENTNMTVIVSAALKPKRGEPLELPGKEFVMRSIESGESAADYMREILGDDSEATERGFAAKRPASKAPLKPPAAKRRAAAKQRRKS